MNITYAADTSVSVEKSRAELEAILSRYGADTFGYMVDQKGATIMFRMGGKAVRFNLPLPDRNAKDFTHRKVGRSIITYQLRNPADAHKLWEQACRSRWRSLVLCVKAKLEACASGITTFEAEFLAHFVLNTGETVAQIMLPRLPEIISGKLPPMLSAPPHLDQ